MPCACSHRTYEQLDRRIRLVPGWVAVAGDGDLAKLATPLPTDPALAARVVGEIFVRRWLYEDRCPPELLAIKRRGPFTPVIHSFRDLAVPLRNHRKTRATAVAHKMNASFDSPLHEAIWQHLHERIIDFLECDGIFPLVIGNDCDEAVAVPFRFANARSHRGKAIDKRGREIPEWSGAVAALDRDLDRGHAVQILCEFPDEPKCPQGDSLAFALVVAKHAKRGGIRLSPLEILATGAVQDGRLQPINGRETKQALGDRLGCSLFIAPGFFEDKFVLFLVPQQSVKDLSKCLSRELGSIILPLQARRLRICPKKRSIETREIATKPKRRRQRARGKSGGKIPKTR